MGFYFVLLAPLRRTSDGWKRESYLGEAFSSSWGVSRHSLSPDRFCLARPICFTSNFLFLIFVALSFFSCYTGVGKDCQGLLAMRTLCGGTYTCG